MSDSDRSDSSDNDYSPKQIPVNYNYTTQKATFSGPLIVVNNGSHVTSYLDYGSSGGKYL